MQRKKAFSRYEYFKQLGEGNGIDSIEPRDREDVLNDPNSSLVQFPQDNESRMIMHLYNTTPLEHGAHGVVGFNYHALKDNIKWNNMSQKIYVPILLRCISSYLEASSKKE